MSFSALRRRIPNMMKLSGKPEVSEGDSLFFYNYFLYLDSEDTFCIIDRAVMSALQKMTVGVALGNLDILVVDMPPGTGDAQLNILQRLQLSGARRGANIFCKVEVLILGVIKNMSCFKGPHCGEPSYIFGSEGARQTVDEMDMEFLGEVC
ncbi:hypothetical protein GIB67_015262 [Kingdonia uniflora]|uniref:Uncharacterized protein n=1 Tax=Kingdonia uniflora TaxID=39325 RepID=A0A7J7MST5_9MAGN|nr:hypothetical protein GIB67_015262 [Kingdonia uniflora]